MNQTPVKKGAREEAQKDRFGSFAYFWLGPVLIPVLLGALTGSWWLAGGVSLGFLCFLPR